MYVYRYISFIYVCVLFTYTELPMGSSWGVGQTASAASTSGALRLSEETSEKELEGRREPNMRCYHIHDCYYKNLNRFSSSGALGLVLVTANSSY